MLKDEIKQVKSLEKEIAPFLSAKGFKEKEPVLNYNADLGPDVKADLSINIKGWEGDYSFQTIYTITFNQVEKYWVKYKADLNEADQPRHPTLAFIISDIDPQQDTGYHDMFGKSRYKASTDKDVQEFAGLFKKQYNELVEPLIKQAADIRWMNEKLNSNPMDFKQVAPFHKQHLILRKLIIAKLAGDKKYEDIYTQFRDLCARHIAATNDELSKKILMVIDKVHEDLKKVEPLQNPVLL